VEMRAGNSLQRKDSLKRGPRAQREDGYLLFCPLVGKDIAAQKKKKQSYC